MKKHALALLAIGLSLSLSVVAQDEEADAVEYGWTGSGEFGLVKTTGNTDTEAVNLKLEFIHTSELWRERLFASALSSSKDGEQDSERYVVEAQGDRILSEKSYLFVVGRWDSDKFGSYDPQASVAAGYGRQFIKTDTHEFKGEIGAGYRRLEERVTGITSDEAIVRGLLEDGWQITDSTMWHNRLLVESGSDNTFTQFNTDLAVAINAKLALKLGYEVRNNSTLPAGSTDKTDTVTTVNLVYHF